MLALAGRHDRVCPVAGAEQMAELLPNQESHIFEDSAHMLFVEETERYLDVVRMFPARVR